MFSWFAPSCPVDDAAKQWIESRLRWLATQFGLDVLTRRAVILPTSDFFPDPIDGSKSSVHKLLCQVCRYMDADPEAVDLEFIVEKPDLWIVNDEGKYLPTGAGGLFDEQPGRTVIHIATGEMDNLEGLVGVMAHELSHLRLMGEGRVTGDEFDNELLTDLTALFHGFGIFRGNSPRNWDGQYGIWPGTNLRCPEYMTLPMFGYALAHTAWLRGEEKPEWAKFLSFELRPVFKQGLRFLYKTGDTSMTAD